MAGTGSAISALPPAALSARKRCDKHSTKSWKSWHLQRPVTLSSSKTESNTTSDLCLEGCKYDKQHAANEMVRCCQCSSWIHADCIAEKEEYVPGVWSCFRCQLMPSHICQMQTDLSNLVTLVQTLTTSVTSLRDDHQKLSKQLEDREETCNRLLKENSDLRAQIGALF